MRSRLSVRGKFFSSLLLLCLALAPVPLSAEVNSWLSPVSGNWEDNQWSLGTLPGAGQSVMITNAGWKAVAITPNTLNFPDSLSVYSVTLSSPVDSHNVLLFNYPGQAVPLTARFFTVSSNAAVTMYNGALKLSGGQGEGLSLGGEFNQESSSTVLGSQVDIGYVGPGVYNLRSGTVWLQHIWLGGFYGGKMIQTGGTNAADIVHLEAGGEYTLVDGDFNAVNVYFGSLLGATQGGVFRQQGGRINTGLTVYRGTYELEGGSVYGSLKIPPSDGFSDRGGPGLMLQSGGTNFASLEVGYIAGAGTYVLSNGVSRPPTVIVGALGQVEQWNGSQAITGTLSTLNDWVGRQVRGYGVFTLNGGGLSAAAMDVGGHYIQNGGTAVISGDIVVNSGGTEGGVVINGGELRSHGTSVTSFRLGGYQQTGGRHVIASRLTVTRTFPDPFYQGCRLEGGELVAPEIILGAGATFVKTGGVLSVSLLTMSNANLSIGSGMHQFGRLSVQSASASQTNSTVYLPPSSERTVLSFQNSSQVPWSVGATLTLVNWKGSWAGGGAHQVLFGSDSAGLSQAQLAQIRFQDPLGFFPGLYRARMLFSGEIVPDALPPTGRIPPVISLMRLGNGTMQITLRGETTGNYGIDMSSSLSDWTRWTNVSTPQGTITVVDDQAPYAAQRFYRALLLP